MNSEYIKEWRSSNNLSHEEMAFILGVETDILRDWESGAKSVPQYIYYELLHFEMQKDNLADFVERRVAQRRAMESRRFSQRRASNMEIPADSRSEARRATVRRRMIRRAGDINMAVQGNGS